MDDLESKISQILENPDSMAQILSIAKSLGVAPPQDAPGQEDQTADPLGDSFGPMLELLRSAGPPDPRETALLNALKPYCTKERQQRIDRALRIARISQLAGAALRKFEKKE